METELKSRDRCRLISAAEVRTLDAQYRARRAAYFPQAYLVESPWSLLLDIERAMRMGDAVTCSATDGLPTAVRARYLALFEADGLIERRCDPRTPGGELVVLTPSALLRLDEMFESAALDFNRFPAAPPQ